MGKPGPTLVIATSGAAAALAEASHMPSIRNKIKGTVAKIAKKSAKKSAIVKAIVNRAGSALTLEADTASVRLLANKLVKMKNSERMAVPGIGPKRSEIIIGGAFVYAQILERLQLGGFRYSPLGLRDGILAQMLSDIDQRASVHKAVEAERWEGVMEVCARYNIDPKRAEPVRDDALRIFDAMERVHNLPDIYRELLSAASMMNEVGKFMNHQGHHRHTQYIIENSEIFGFSPGERTMMSAIARYLGKSRPDAMERPLRSIPVEEHSNVIRCVVILRLAVAMHQGRMSSLGLQVRVYPKRVLLTLRPGRGGAELERWSLEKEAVYFREIFRRDLSVELA